MGILNKLFGSSESVAKEIAIDKTLIEKHWKDYLATIPKKREILAQLQVHNFYGNLSRLKQLLTLELADIKNEEREDIEILSDLGTLEHSKKIMRVHRLERCLAYAETKHEYVYALLQQLFHVLNAEMRLLESDISEKTILKLRSQFGIEHEIIKKIEKIQTFHSLFAALAKGEHIVRTMDSKEKILLKKMQKTFEKGFAGEIDLTRKNRFRQALAVTMINAKYKLSKTLSDGMTQEAIDWWTTLVFNSVEDKVHEAVAKGIIEGYHPDIDFQYVNNPNFIGLVREKAREAGNKRVSEQKINVFVHVFREWYNQREGLFKENQLN
ncbi:MAG: hypothetical protein Q8O89_04675 [Nanoarchaeota archaeon]|nr:hypothetical protein [Nanoarchaeota archaeon]